jgi:hypothetical protein
LIPTITIDAKGRITSASNNSFSSTPSDGSITAAKLSGAQAGTAPIYGARAYVHFNGQNVTNPASMTGVAASGNISSVLDNGTNDYTVNFTTAFTSANQVVPVSIGYHKNTVVEGFVAVYQGSQTTTSIRLQYRVSAGAGEIEQLYAVFFA